MTQKAEDRTSRWPDYRAVWRWHFYAGLFCIPFICFLAITGSIYLFKPQIDAWFDRPYDHLPTPQVAAPSQAVATVLAANPGWVFHAYELPRTSRAAARVILGRDGVEQRVYVDRGSLHILKSVPENQRFTRVLFHLHGDLLQGDWGSRLVELAASWAIVMILTGLYLWWPRRLTGLGGVVYPRFGGGKLVWRDLHAVTGVWVSLFALVVLFSGLPWAKGWGGYLKEIRQITGAAPVHQDWATGASSELAENKARDAAGMAGMADMPGIGGEHAQVHPGASMPATGLATLDRAAPIVAALDLPPPVVITPPSKSGGPWKARSDTQDRPLRVNLTLDPVTGAVISRSGFGQQKLIDQIVAVGVANHEGQLYGWPNQLVGVVIALGLLTLSGSAVVLWWRRRADGVLGAPIPDGRPRWSLGLAGVVIILGLLLPEFGASLLLVLLVERLLLRRIPLLARWLGLRAAFS